MPRAPRLWTALLVVAALSTSAVFSLEARRGAATPRPRATTVSAIENFLPDLWKSLTRLWGGSGCSVDPYGGLCTNVPAAKPPLPTLENGCGIDPYGSCNH